MKQTTHTWIAVRALALTQKDAKTRRLAEILAPWVRHAYVGCWLPDMGDFKKGHGLTQNHTFKMKPFNGDYAGRFVMNRSKLVARLDPNTAIRGFLNGNDTLSSDWWNRSYKAEQPDGRHLADCMSSLYDAIMDLILLGDEEVDDLVPGDVGFSGYLHPGVTIEKGQISTFFFMLSHYVADCFMPLHCDKRPLAAYSGRIHAQWEKHWDRLVGDYFSKKKLKETTETSQQIIDASTALDASLGLTFNLPITYNTSEDVWEMGVHWCRASFALSSSIFPENQFPYDDQDTDHLPSFGSYFTDKSLLEQWDRIILQTAVYSVAGMWKKIWRKFKA